MTEQPNAGAGGQGDNVQPQQQQEVQQPQNQAPYAEYLNKVPESARGLVEPVFKEWDANYTRMTQQYTDRLNQYKPYDQIIQAVGSPETMQAAIQMAYELQQNPEDMFNRLAEHLGYELDDEEANANNDGQSAVLDPRIEAMESGLNDLTQLIQQQHEEQELDKESQQIFAQLDDVEQQRGLPLDRELVLTRAIETDDLDGAIEWYYQKFGPVLQQQNNQQGPPTPLGGGGGLPSQTKSLQDMTPQERKQFVISTLNAAKQQAQ